jgi:hypothetical protein
MAFRRQEVAERELAQYFQIFRAAVKAGYRRFWDGDFVADLDKGTRARVIRDFVVAELRRQLDGQRQVYIDDTNQTALFCIGTNWAVQVHKLDECGEVSKNYTQLAMDLRRNTIDESLLPNIPSAATVLFLGYVDSDIEHPEIWLACPGERNETWMIDLSDEAQGAPVEEIKPVTPIEPGTQIVINSAARRQRKEQ